MDDIVEGIVGVMQLTSEKVNGEDGLPPAPYRVYNIGGSHWESLLGFVQVLSEELVRIGVFIILDYDFKTHQEELVSIQPSDVCTSNIRRCNRIGT